MVVSRGRARAPVTSWTRLWTRLRARGAWSPCFPTTADVEAADDATATRKASDRHCQMFTRRVARVTWALPTFQSVQQN